MHADAIDGSRPRMHPQQWALACLNVLGGAAVLGSYVHGLLSNPAARGDLWGGIPAFLQPLYTANMFVAAAGYLLFTHLVVLRLDPVRVRVGRFGYRVFHLLYASILVPSALWLPLTFEMLSAPSVGLWWLIRLDLALVAIGSLGLLSALLRVEPVGSETARRLALAGCLPFCLQTAVLDALVWPARFPF